MWNNIPWRVHFISTLALPQHNSQAPGAHDITDVVASEDAGGWGTFDERSSNYNPTNSCKLQNIYDFNLEDQSFTKVSSPPPKPIFCIKPSHLATPFSKSTEELILVKHRSQARASHNVRQQWRCWCSVCVDAAHVSFSLCVSSLEP